MEHLDLLLEHWPFVAVAMVLWLVGHFMETSVFTKARATAPGKLNWVWWWGRESMELHPLIAGALIGLVWHDPEGAGWSRVGSIAYFAFAGVASLFVWMVLSRTLARRGTSFRLPGESLPPGPKNEKLDGDDDGA